jgi:hypothetical protein
MSVYLAVFRRDCVRNLSSHQPCRVIPSMAVLLSVFMSKHLPKAHFHQLHY